MRLSSNEIESQNHRTQLTVKPPPLTLSRGSVPTPWPFLYSSHWGIVEKDEAADVRPAQFSNSD